MIGGSVTAGVYGLMSQPAPTAYYHAIGFTFGPATACHAAAWLVGRETRASGLIKFVGLCAGAIILASLVWFGTGEREAQRAHVQQMQRADAVRKAQGELAKLEAQRAEIASFRPTSGKAVAALEAALAALAQQRTAECARQSTQCQTLVEDERTKLRELDVARADKAATDAVKRLDAVAASIQADLAKPPPAAPSEFQELTGLSLTEGATKCVLLLAVTFTLGGALTVATTFAGRRQAQVPTLTQARRPWFASVADGGSLPSPRQEGRAPSRDEHAIALAKLEAALFPEGDVHTFANECVRSSQGKTTRLNDIFQHYRVWCRRQVPPRPPVKPEEFGSIFKSLCDKHGAGIRCVGERFYADNLELKIIS